jgi:predicted glutamine amidotransferase
MCRLLGLYGQIDFWQDITIEFSKLSQFGNLPPVDKLEPGHKDGWGMTMCNREKSAMVPLIRQLGAAYNSTCYRKTVYSMAAMPAVFMCHLRKASEQIPITLSNTHPFCHNGWALIHNGTVYRPESLPRDRYINSTSDGSDTECFFHFLLTKITDAPPGKKTTQTVIDAIRSITVDYTALNSMLSNGEELYVIASYKKWDAYYTMYFYPLATGIIVCSEPIVSEHLDPKRWISLANNTLLRLHGSPPQIDKIQIGSSG